MPGTGRGFTTDNKCASCVRANFLLTKNTTQSGTQRNNDLEISELFLSGKQRAVYSYIFSFIIEPTLILNVPWC
jgi:hypothetical protein